MHEAYAKRKRRRRRSEKRQQNNNNRQSFSCDQSSWIGTPFFTILFHEKERKKERNGRVSLFCFWFTSFSVLPIFLFRVRVRAPNSIAWAPHNSNRYTSNTMQKENNHYTFENRKIIIITKYCCLHCSRCVMRLWS